MNNDKLTVDFLRLILIHELGIDEKRVNVYNQKFKIPPDDGMFITLECRNTKIISSRNTTGSSGDSFQERQDLNVLEDISIGIFSKTTEAIKKKDLAAMALYSIYSQQVQEEQNFKIFRNPSILALQMAEGAALLYRFDLEVKVLAWYSNVKNAQWFDQHNVQVIVNDGVPDLKREFEIPDTDPTVYPKT